LDRALERKRGTGALSLEFRNVVIASMFSYRRSP
jgi:hypothetical protein